MAEKPYPSPANLTEQLQNLCWRLAVEMRALYNTVKTKMTKAEADEAYLGKSAKAASATKADTATKASQDAKGNVIDQTYAKNSSIPTVMKGATSAAAGAAGTVPAPAKGDQAKFLNGSGAWATALTSQTQADWNASTGVAAIKNKPTIPTKTSQLTNDSNFATTGAIPTKVSQLTNDSGYLTTQVRADWNATSGAGVINNKPTIPTRTSQLTNDSNFAATSAIPTKVSQLTNDTGFTTGDGVMGGERGSIELTPLTTASHGGFIDFHWKGSTADYTSRISETAESGRLDVTAPNGFYVNGTKVPRITSSTTDLTAGSSALTTGDVYLVYE